MKRIIISVVALILLLTMGIFAQDVSEKVSYTNDTRSYLIGPGDKIIGKVMGEEDFNFEVVVDDDGKFELPFVDTMINAQCRTERDIKDEVKEKYSKFLRNPLISVQVAERRKPTPVTVAGEIKTPGQVELKREANLLELITFSGDVTEDAGGIVKVIRTQIPLCSDETTRKNWETESDNGQNTPSRVYRLSNIKAGIKESNPIIYPGDLIVVDKAVPVYFTGEFRNPTGVYIKEGGLSLTQAIAMVGGTLDKAQTKDIKIYRLKGENPLERDEMSVNYELIRQGKAADIMLQPYDIIDIDKKKKNMAQTIIEVALGMAKTGAGTLISGGTTRILY